jgi:hypothetical protein
MRAGRLIFSLLLCTHSTARLIPIIHVGSRLLSFRGRSRMHRIPSSSGALPYDLMTQPGQERKESGGGTLLHLFPTTLPQVPERGQELGPAEKTAHSSLPGPAPLKSCSGLRPGREKSKGEI